MMIALMIAGIGLLLGGLLTVGLGIQLDLSFGNTLILTGAVVACTGTILIGLGAVLRELRSIGQRLGSGLRSNSRAQDGLQSLVPEREPFTGEETGASDVHAQLAAATAPPWHDFRDRARDDVSAVPEPIEAAPAPKPRRNLLFSSSVRKERERAPTVGSKRDPHPGSPDLAGAVPQADGPSPGTFGNAWPKSERTRAADPAAPRRSGRTPSTFSEANAGATGQESRSPAAHGEQQPLTVLKSGIVDGMAYSLYSDGSIEAQMPEGMMRFASIEELRTHLDQRS